LSVSEGDWAAGQAGQLFFEIFQKLADIVSKNVSLFCGEFEYLRSIRGLEVVDITPILRTLKIEKRRMALPV
jgi:hypothetical protein